MTITSRYPIEATPPSELFESSDALQAIDTAGAVIQALEQLDQPVPNPRAGRCPDYDWIMATIQLKTGTAKPGNLAATTVNEALFQARVVRMGVVQPPTTTEAAMEALLREGICARAASQWLAKDPCDGKSRDRLLAEAYQGLEECPSPATEWQGLRELFGDEALAALLSISAPSVRRYAKGERPCPDPVAARLHGLALLIEPLEGSYNAYGLRRWFQRPRASLGGQSPQQRLQGNWDPGDASVQPVVELARATSFGLVAS